MADLFPDAHEMRSLSDLATLAATSGTKLALRVIPAVAAFMKGTLSELGARRREYSSTVRTSRWIQAGACALRACASLGETRDIEIEMEEEMARVDLAVGEKRRDEDVGARAKAIADICIICIVG